MNTPDSIEVSENLVRALADIAGQPDLDHQLKRLVELAQRTVGYGEAAVWTVRSNGAPESAHAPARLWKTS